MKCDLKINNVLTAALLCALTLLLAAAAAAQDAGAWPRQITKPGGTSCSLSAAG